MGRAPFGTSLHHHEASADHSAERFFVCIAPKNGSDRLVVILAAGSCSSALRWDPQEYVTACGTLMAIVSMIGWGNLEKKIQVTVAPAT